MLKIENNIAEACFYTKGAELCSFKMKDTATEYIWQGSAQYWNKHSPILFPIVGSLKDGKYHYNGNIYNLSRHGFARDMEFEVLSHDDNSISFQLLSDATTMNIYPFSFQLIIQYTLIDSCLKVEYSVINPSTEILYFSIGAHPGFNVPIAAHLQSSDYNIEINIQSNAPLPLSRYPINQDGLLLNPEPFLDTNPFKAAIHDNLFQKDAIVLKHIEVATITISSSKDARFVTVQYDHFPFLGIWGKPNGNFVCIEPWQGVADSVDASGDLTYKEGIIALNPNSKWEQDWSITIG